MRPHDDETRTKAPRGSLQPAGEAYLVAGRSHSGDVMLLRDSCAVVPGEVATDTPEILVDVGRHGVRQVRGKAWQRIEVELPGQPRIAACSNAHGHPFRVLVDFALDRAAGSPRL